MYCCLPATFKHAMSCLLFIQKEINNSRESIFTCETKLSKGVLLRVLDVESVEHQGQVRKLLPTKEGTVFKVKRSKPKNIVKPEQYP